MTKVLTATSLDINYTLQIGVDGSGEIVTAKCSVAVGYTTDGQSIVRSETADLPTILNEGQQNQLQQVINGIKSYFTNTYL